MCGVRRAAIMSRMTPDPTLAMMEAVNGTCAVCLAPLKWAEIHHVDHPDGTRTITRMLICKNNHQTAIVNPTASP
jgi:hypothetical protein